MISVKARGHEHLEDASGERAWELYQSQEEAALAALSDFLHISQDVNMELGGGIYEKDGQFFYTDAFEGISNKMPGLVNELTCEANSLGLDRVAWWHTHPSPPGEKPGDSPSDGDRANSLILGLGFVAGPSGVATSFFGDGPATVVGSLWETGTVGVEYASAWGLRVRAQ